MTDIHHNFLCMAIALAEKSVGMGGFPAGSVLVKDGKVISEAVSVGNLIHDPTSHSDLAAIRTASVREGRSDLSGSILYSSVQPCLMCLGASAWAGVSGIFYACAQDRLDAAYYGGHYKGHEINASFLRPINMVHCQDLEDKSLNVVRSWEKSFT